MSEDLPVSFGREFEPEPEPAVEQPQPSTQGGEGGRPGGGGRPETGREFPPAPSAPPRKHSTTWPGVFGVLGIVFGILGSIGNLGTFAWPVFRPWMMELISREVSRHEYHLIRNFIPGDLFIFSSGVIELGLSVLLLIAGVYLLQRRQLGARLIKLWAIISIPWALLESGFGMSFTRSLIPRLREFGTTEFPIEFFTSLGIGFGLLFALIVPVFVLVWFGSQNIRTEVEGWPD